MSANTIVMYFKVDAGALRQKEVRNTLKQLGVTALGKLEGEPVVIDLGNEEDQLLIFQGQEKSHAVIRVYSHGLVTVDVQYYVASYQELNDSPYDLEDIHVKQLYAVGNRKLQLSEEYIRVLESKLRKHLGNICRESNSLFAPIRRGQPIWPYAVTADERLMENDYDKTVFEKDSAWQNIRIVHSREHGNVLFLDGDLMLGESDLVYTQTVCGIGHVDYKDKEVLILGGGDGGILHELLKEHPKFITMAEIDEEVIKACRIHMRSACGDTMDNFDGPNFKIVIGDCLNVLHESIQRGKMYDYVINDLTEFPVEKALHGHGYDFETASLITELSLKALTPDGKLLARGNCLTAIDYRLRFEADLKTLGCEFKRKDVYVPSFHETYCLYEVWQST